MICILQNSGKGSGVKGNGIFSCSKLGFSLVFFLFLAMVKLQLGMV